MRIRLNNSGQVPWRQPVHVLQDTVPPPPACPHPPPTDTANTHGHGHSHGHFPCGGGGTSTPSLRKRKRSSDGGLAWDSASLVYGTAPAHHTGTGHHSRVDVRLLPGVLASTRTIAARQRPSGTKQRHWDGYHTHPLADLRHTRQRVVRPRPAEQCKQTSCFNLMAGLVHSPHHITSCLCSCCTCVSQVNTFCALFEPCRGVFIGEREASSYIYKLQKCTKVNNYTHISTNERTK